MRVARQITLVEKDRRMLERWSRGRRTPARLVMRAKIALKAAAGMKNKDIAAEIGTDRLTVARWRRRFAERGLTGIEKDKHRGGRKPRRSRIRYHLNETLH